METSDQECAYIARQNRAFWFYLAGRCGGYVRLCVFLVLTVLTARSSSAHPGGLAADGCHYCRTNCAKWGEVAGERHCHGQASRARQNGQPPARQPQAAQDRSRKIPVEIRGSVPRIVDADTLEVAGQKVRLHGIDAPESAQSCRQAGGHRYPCGEHATQALRTRIGPDAVTCTIEGRDRYDRALGICYAADGTDLNGWLVRQGHALAYRRYSTQYVPEEDQAKAAQAGLWAGAFIKPWDWRRGARLD